MSEVRYGRHLATGREVVLKAVPLEDEAAGAQLTARLAQEAEVLGRLARDGQRTDIAELVEFRVIAGRPMLVMGLVPGMTLRDWQKQSALPDRERVEVLRQVAVAVAYAHGRGVAHRDLKPSNVMIRPDGNAVVLDFGIAALLEGAKAAGDELTLTGTVLGTAHYMAPEQAAGRCLLAEKADVYALGVMLFELLTGDLPVGRKGSEHDDAYRERIKKTYPRRLRRVRRDVERGADLEAVCMRVLMREPDHRPGAEVLAEELARWRRGEAVLSGPLSWRESVVLAVKQHPWQWALSAAAVLVLGAVALRMTYLESKARAAEGVARKARAEAQHAEADSIAAVAAETAGRGKVDEAIPDMVKALRLDPKNPVAGWLAGQTLLDRSRMVRLGSVPFAAFSQDAYYFEFGAREFYALRSDGALCRGLVSEDGAQLQVAPWPSADGGQCVAVAVSPDRAMLVVALADGALRAWQTGTGRLLWECEAVPGVEQSVRFSISRRLVVQAAISGKPGSSSTLLRLVAAGDGKVVREVPLPQQHTSAHQAAVTADDRWLVTGSSHSVWLGCTKLEDGTTRDLTEIWNDREGAGALYDLVALENGTQVMVSGQCQGMRVLCLDAEAGTMKWDEPVLGRTRNYTVAVENIVVAPGGAFFAVTGSEGDAMLHRTEDGKPAGPLLSCPVRGRALEFAGTDELVQSGQRTTVWNWRAGSRITAPLPHDMHPLGDGLFLSVGGAEPTVWRLGGVL